MSVTPPPFDHGLFTPYENLLPFTVDRVTYAVLQHLLLRVDSIDRHLATITQQEQTMSDQQAHLDADVAKIEADDQRILDAVAALKAQHPDVDFSKLDAAIAGEDTAASAVEGLEPPPAPPAEPQPVDDAGNPIPVPTTTPDPNVPNPVSTEVPVTDTNNAADQPVQGQPIASDTPPAV